MPRQIRYIIPNCPHHAIQRGNNRQPVFFDKEDRDIFLNNLKKHSVEEKALVGSYCLMSNHIHLLLYPDREEGLIRLMKFLSQLHTQHINRKFGRTGKLWENRYKLHVVDPEYEWAIARYIEGNPVRAGIVKNPEQYEYSSANAHLKGKSNKYINIDIIKNRRDEYIEYFHEKDAYAQEHINRIKAIIQQEKPLGSDNFIKQVETQFKVLFKIRNRGRPKKK